MVFRSKVLSKILTNPQTATITNKPTIPKIMVFFAFFLFSSSPPAVINPTTPTRNITTATAIKRGIIQLRMDSILHITYLIFFILLFNSKQVAPLAKANGERIKATGMYFLIRLIIQDSRFYDNLRPLRIFIANFLLFR